ncbi:ATP-binding cassette domain-containing protein [candidate division KSB3 bacterium]|uniref:ATP-binding cassette domain-containing protein n=1 Tax=candidate division KSB3 bacterium TaxID=2044937 RepID=A0A9D5JZ94_9BACT|nr:ATP-binding cassette domain-containing protein [candidate division KSB3 bacterium]MBD3326963.1 ATP-binding cassette domain-containing protein [candidate division KSB3 bacterium]
MNDDVAIRVEHVSKKYCKSLKRSMLYGIQDIGRNMLGCSSYPEQLRKDEFWAIDDVSFEVKKGEALGIIGRNGSGKTTLLKMLNGIFWPDKGKITVKGRVGALIQVGAGFHPLLTGRENIYINAAILGMTKEKVDAQFDAIVEFADIGDFLDAPVKHYSSGMFVRLGFAVAIFCKPEILLIDEVLAVGDVGFKIKSLNKIKDVMQQCAVVFVSHQMQLVAAICTKTLVLERGQVKLYSNTPAEGIEYYAELFESGGMVIHGEHVIEIINAELLDSNKHIIRDARVEYMQQVFIKVNFNFLQERNITVKINIQNSEQNNVMTFFEENPTIIQYSKHETDVILDIGAIDLRQGKYSVMLNVLNKENNKRLCKIDRLLVFHVSYFKSAWADIIKPMNVTAYIPETIAGRFQTRG